MPNLVELQKLHGRDAIEQNRNQKLDVVLLDVNMPGLSGVEVVEELKFKEKCSIIMLTISKHEEDLLGAINAGADGYMLKNAEPDDLRKAILQVSEGNSVLSPEVTHQVLKIVANMQGYLPDKGISKRELETHTPFK
jgi:DNA-binding NarL/FixJ family response regulator